MAGEDRLSPHLSHLSPFAKVIREVGSGASAPEVAWPREWLLRVDLSRSLGVEGARRSRPTREWLHRVE